MGSLEKNNTSVKASPQKQQHQKDPFFGYVRADHVDYEQEQRKEQERVAGAVMMKEPSYGIDMYALDDDDEEVTFCTSKYLLFLLGVMAIALVALFCTFLMLARMDKGAGASEVEISSIHNNPFETSSSVVIPEPQDSNTPADVIITGSQSIKSVQLAGPRSKLMWLVVVIASIALITGTSLLLCYHYCFDNGDNDSVEDPIEPQEDLDLEEYPDDQSFGPFLTTKTVLVGVLAFALLFVGVYMGTRPKPKPQPQPEPLQQLEELKLNFPKPSAPPFTPQPTPQGTPKGSPKKNHGQNDNAHDNDDDAYPSPHSTSTTPPSSPPPTDSPTPAPKPKMSARKSLDFDRPGAATRTAESPLFSPYSPLFPPHYKWGHGMNPAYHPSSRFQGMYHPGLSKYPPDVFSRTPRGIGHGFSHPINMASISQVPRRRSPSPAKQVDTKEDDGVKGMSSENKPLDQKPEDQENTLPKDEPGKDN